MPFPEPAITDRPALAIVFANASGAPEIVWYEWFLSI